MRLCFDNRGVIGHAAYPGVIGGIDPGPDSIGLEYPLGQPYEHIFGGGVWVGGKLDTAQIGTSAPITLVTTAYEGWSGPYFEFYPGSSLGDSIWKVSGRGIPRPTSWEAYWGDLIPSVSFSDNDHYCLYDDDHIHVAGHVPLRLRIAQNSYVWSDPYAEAIHIIEYRIVNTGLKPIDSAYVGVLVDGDVGPYRVPYYGQRNLVAYYPDIRTAYLQNPVDSGSTPVGLTVLAAPRPLDSLKTSFRWWTGSSQPNTDALRYQKLSAGVIDSNQPVTDLADTRWLISFGPFTIHPAGGSNPDTVVVAFGIVCGQNLTAMRQHAIRAKIIYENGGMADVGSPTDDAPAQFMLFQNYPNPFNPATTIRFTLPKSAFVRLSIFNILGEEITTLVDREVSGGTHSLVWEARGNASGVYFCKIRAGSLVQTRKLMLLR